MTEYTVMAEHVQAGDRLLSHGGGIVVDNRPRGLHNELTVESVDGVVYFVTVSKWADVVIRDQNVTNFYEDYLDHQP